MCKVPNLNYIPKNLSAANMGECLPQLRRTYN